MEALFLVFCCLLSLSCSLKKVQEGWTLWRRVNGASHDTIAGKGKGAKRHWGKDPSASFASGCVALCNNPVDILCCSLDHLVEPALVLGTRVVPVLPKLLQWGGLQQTEGWGGGGVVGSQERGQQSSGHPNQSQSQSQSELTSVLTSFREWM